MDFRPVRIVRARLSNIRRWYVCSVLLQAALLGTGLLALFWWALAWFVVSVSPSRGFLLLASGSCIVMVCLSQAAITFPLWNRRDSLLGTAREVERRQRGLFGRLSSAIEFSQTSPSLLSMFSPTLLTCALVDAARTARGVPRLVLARAHHFWLIGGIGLALLLAPWLFSLRSAYTLRDLWRIYWSALQPPSPDRLLVEPGNTRILVGEDVTIRVAAMGLRLSRAALFFRTGDGAGETVPMTGGDADSWSVVLRGVRQDTLYAVETNIGRSPDYWIVAARVPQLERIRVHYTYPGYTGRPAELGPEDEGNIRAVVGTTVRILAQYDVPLASARLSLEPQRLSPAYHEMTPTADVWTASFVLDRSGQYTLVGTSADYKVESPPRTFGIESVPDATPTVALNGIGLWTPWPASGRVRIGCEARDDYALQQVDLVWRARGEKTTERVSLRTFTTTVTSVSTEHTWALPSLRSHALELWLEATDFRGGKPVGRGRSTSAFVGGDPPSPRETGQLSSRTQAGDESGTGGMEDALRAALAKAAERLSQAAQTAERVAQQMEQSAQQDQSTASAQNSGQASAASQDLEEVRRQVQEGSTALERALTAANFPLPQDTLPPVAESTADPIADTGADQSESTSDEGVSQGPERRTQPGKEQESPGGTGQGAQGLPADPLARPRGSGPEGPQAVPRERAGSQSAGAPARLEANLAAVRQALRASAAQSAPSTTGDQPGLNEALAAVERNCAEGRLQAAAKGARRAAAQLADMAGELSALAAGMRPNGEGPDLAGTDSNGQRTAEQGEDTTLLPGEGAQPLTRLWRGPADGAEYGVDVLVLGGWQRDHSSAIKKFFIGGQSAQGRYDIAPSGLMPLVDSEIYPRQYREAVARYFTNLSRQVR